MTDEIKKPEWISKVETTASYHRNQLRIHEKWTLKDTSKALNRSIGRVSEDLQLAEALKNTEMRRKLEKFKYGEDALSFLKDKRRESRLS